MTDLDILHVLLNRLRSNSNVARDVTLEYTRLIENFPEHGFGQCLSLDAMSEEQEAAIRELRKLGYIDTMFQYRGTDGHFYHIDLRGPEFLKVPTTPPPQTGHELETFASGAVRDTEEGKTRPDLVSPLALGRIGDCLMNGSKKYSVNNWTRGIPVSRCMASLHRHLMKYMQGDRSEDHLASLVVNGIFVLHFEEAIKRGILPESLLDLPDYSVISGVQQNRGETPK